MSAFGRINVATAQFGASTLLSAIIGAYVCLEMIRLGLV